MYKLFPGRKTGMESFVTQSAFTAKLTSCNDPLDMVKLSPVMIYL